MQTASKRSPSSALVTILALIGGFFLLQKQAAYKEHLPDIVRTEVPLAATAENAAKRDAITLDQGLASQTDPARPPDKSEATSITTENSIDAQFIQKSLQRVEIDSDGNLVFNHAALQTLYDTIGYGGLSLSKDQIADVQALIRDGLPGKAGNQAAETVDSFYRYLDAKKIVDEMYQHSDSAEDQGFRMEDLRALRQLFFGAEQADLLFSRQAAHEHYMLANMTLSQDGTLSEDERAQGREELSRRILETDYGIVNWSSRSDSFSRQKEAILNTSLSATEKAAQIDALFRQHFTAAEAERIEDLNIAQF